MKQQTKICILLIALVVLGTTGVLAAQTVKEMNQPEYQRRLELQRRNGIKAGNVYRDKDKGEFHPFVFIPEFEPEERWQVSVFVEDELYYAKPPNDKGNTTTYSAPNESKTTLHQYHITLRHKDNRITVEQEMPVEDASLYFGRMVMPESSISSEMAHKDTDKRVEFQPIDEAIKTLKASGIQLKPNQRQLVKEQQQAFAKLFGPMLWGMPAGRYDFKSPWAPQIWSKSRGAVGPEYKGAEQHMLLDKSSFAKYSDTNHFFHSTGVWFDDKNGQHNARALCLNAEDRVSVEVSAGYNHVLEMATHRVRRGRMTQSSHIYKCMDMDKKPVFVQRRRKEVVMKFKRLP